MCWGLIGFSSFALNRFFFFGFFIYYIRIANIYLFCRDACIKVGFGEAPIFAIAIGFWPKLLNFARRRPRIIDWNPTASSIITSRDLTRVRPLMLKPVGFNPFGNDSN